MTNRVLSIIKSDLPEKWQQILSDLITDPKELSQILELDPGDHRVSDVAINQFPLKVPRSFVGQIVKGNWEDPLLRQIWPSTLEEEYSRIRLRSLNGEAVQPNSRTTA